MKIKLSNFWLSIIIQFSAIVVFAWAIFFNMHNINKKIDLVQEEIQTIKTESTSLGNEISSISSLNQKISSLDQQLGELKKEITTLNEQGKTIEELNTKLINLEKSLEVLKKEVEKQKQKLSYLSKTSTTVLASRSNSAHFTSYPPSADQTIVKELTVKATAYTSYCNGCSGETYTGINLRQNPNAKVIAVDPKVIPLGSKVWVDGYGYALAADIGTAIKGAKIDVFFPTIAETSKWGVRTVKIKVYGK